MNLTLENVRHKIIIKAQNAPVLLAHIQLLGVNNFINYVCCTSKHLACGAALKESSKISFTYAYRVDSTALCLDFFFYLLTKHAALIIHTTVAKTLNGTQKLFR